MTDQRQVLLGVTGSIAAYKAAELVRLMQKRGWDVRVVMTRGAAQFVTELTFRTLSQHPVGLDMFEKQLEWIPEHISLADRADVFVIAPCTANVMAKIAHGIADDLLTATVLSSRTPLVIAPAMNVKMWENHATQDNVTLLRSRGVTMVDVREGDLACGYQGKGCLADLDAILGAVEAKFLEIGK
jgi:phosphopantothenoylcysteine decarboxylase / phosphopantothenate---cysteine ligase